MSIMIKQHDAVSLARYLGQQVQYSGDVYRKPFSGELVKITFTFCEIISISTGREGINYIGKPRPIPILPILKPYTTLLTPMIYEGKEILPIEYIYETGLPLDSWYIRGTTIEQKKFSDDGPEICRNFDYIRPSHDQLSRWETDMVRDLSPLNIDKLTRLGFGSIPNKKSPTGYVDLFGYPCICQGKRMITGLKCV